MANFIPAAKQIAACEKHIALMESTFREHYVEGGLVARIGENDNPSDSLETYTFAFGMMASILRSAHALVILCQNGLSVESRPIFRSLLDQIIALYSVRSLGVHAVHAYGKQLASNYEQLLRASETGFELGRTDRAYIEMFLALAKQLPETKDGKAAENAIKTYHAAQESGGEAQAIYQMWLEATPLSKPSMRLADMHINAVPVGDGQYRVELHFETDPDAVVDPRLLASTVIPLAMIAYGDIVEDSELKAKSIALAEGAPRK